MAMTADADKHTNKIFSALLRCKFPVRSLSGSRNITARNVSAGFRDVGHRARSLYRHRHCDTYRSIHCNRFPPRLDHRTNRQCSLHALGMLGTRSNLHRYSQFPDADRCTNTTLHKECCASGSCKHSDGARWYETLHAIRHHTHSFRCRCRYLPVYHRPAFFRKGMTAQYPSFARRPCAWQRFWLFYDEALIAVEIAMITTKHAIQPAATATKRTNSFTHSGLIALRTLQ